jgi:hypothetical protein
MSMARKDTSDKSIPIPWHRLFGLLLSDYLEGTPFTVELEMDLSHHKQLLDVIVVRKRPGELLIPMPDGLTDLVDHNLISFKSFREPLDDWALKELTGHYVNYRKQTSLKGELRPETDYHLYAVCARSPRELLKVVQHQKIQEGVYDCYRGTDRIRVVVAGELALQEKNALIHLFSAVEQRIQYGREHYHLQSSEMSSLVDVLLEGYLQGSTEVPYTIKDLERDLVQQLSQPTKLELISQFSPEQVLSTMSPKAIQAYLKKLAAKKAVSLPRKGKTKRKKD